MNYRLAYASVSIRGRTSRSIRHSPRSSWSSWLGRRTGTGRPTVRRLTSAPAAESGACSSRSAAGA